MIVTLDTTRADRIGAYGRDNASTPVLDSLATAGFLFEQCHSTNPITTPSHSTIMTGCYPMLHGVRDNGLFVLPDERTTLAEVFQTHGWTTGAAVGSFPVTRQFGLAQGFGFYDDHIESPYEDFRGDRIDPNPKIFFDERPAAAVNQAIIPWIEANADGPFFSWVHYFDPHQPLVPPTPYDELYAGDLYQGEVAYTDESLGRVLAALERLDVADRTLIVVVADHGEGIGDHDEMTHSMLCYESTIRVPLIIKIPGQDGGIRITDQVGTVDLAPTILDLVGLPQPKEVQGRSLRSLIFADQLENPGGAPTYYSETLSPRFAYNWSEVRTLVDYPYKYIHTSKPELYNLRHDPSERHDLSSERPDLVEDLRVQLETFVINKSSDSAAEAAGEVDQEMIQRLMALGYVTASGAPVDAAVEEIHDEGIAPQDRARDVSRWSDAKNEIFAGRYLTAREIAQGLVEENPANPLYLTLLALAQLNLGQPDEALATLESSSEIIAHATDLYLAIGRSIATDGDDQRAIELVESLVSTYPSTEGYYTLAGLHKGVGDQNGYRAALKSTLDLDSSYSPARVALAVESARSGGLAYAEEQLEEALEYSPLYPAAHFNLGLVCLDSGRPSEAIGHFDRARTLNTGYWHAYLGLMTAQIELGHPEAAEKVIDELSIRGAPIMIINQANGLLEAR